MSEGFPWISPFSLCNQPVQVWFQMPVVRWRNQDKEERLTVPQLRTVSVFYVPVIWRTLKLSHLDMYSTDHDQIKSTWDLGSHSIQKESRPGHLYTAVTVCPGAWQKSSWRVFELASGPGALQDLPASLQRAETGNRLGAFCPPHGPPSLAKSPALDFASSNFSSQETGKIREQRETPETKPC